MPINDDYVTKKKNQAGFTLAELLVVLALISILLTIVVAKVDLAGDSGKIEVARKEMKEILTAIMGGDKSTTGYYHETRLSEKIPQYVAYLVSPRPLLDAEVDPDLEVNSDLLVWDPNHRRGYRNGGYLVGEEPVIIGGSLQSYLTLIDPWGTPYQIQDHDDESQARVVSLGPNRMPGGNDDLALLIVPQ